jgi:hypothetical protein
MPPVNAPTACLIQCANEVCAASVNIADELSLFCRQPVVPLQYCSHPYFATG